MRRDDERVRSLLERARAGLAPATRSTRLLEAVAWPRSVEREFFASKAERLPEVRYEVDRAALEARIEALAALEGALEGDEPVAVWLRATTRSFLDANRLALAVGTTEFYRLSRELYGGARTRFPGDAARNIDLAEHLLGRFSRGENDAARAHEREAAQRTTTRSAEEVAEAWRALAEREWPGLELRFEVSDEVPSRVIAGATRVRLRSDARFAPWEVRGLWAHEVETHALTAQNGSAQRAAPFLRAGGPRTTRTQEGLAVFAELYAGGLAAPRVARLAERVRLVDMAEQGASFLDLYRHLLAQGSEPRDAFLDAQRVCRGGRVEGGAPFTKDASYLAGLLRVYAFLSVAVRGGLRDEVEMLVSGRVDLDDVPALAELRHRGLLEAPAALPPWLADWSRLLAYFAFASFFNGLNLAAVEQRFEPLLALGERTPET